MWGMTNPTTVKRLGAGVVLAVLMAGSTAGCGDRAPRATPLPPGADVTLVDTTAPTSEPIGSPAEPGQAVPSTAKRAAPTTAPPAATGSTGQADRDLDTIEADLRQLDQDLSRSNTTDEGAVQ